MVLNEKSTFSEMPQVLDFSGRPERVRTSDQLIKSLFFITSRGFPKYHNPLDISKA